MKSARQELFEYMQLLRIRAGAPTYRQIRDGIGEAISVSRVHNAINGPSLPRLETLTWVVNYLTDDQAYRDAARRLWERSQSGGENVPRTKSMMLTVRLHAPRGVGPAGPEGFGAGFTIDRAMMARPSRSASWTATASRPTASTASTGIQTPTNSTSISC